MIRYRIEYWVTKLIVEVTSVFPLKVMRRFGAYLGWLAFQMFRVRRTIVHQNISAAFRDKNPQAIQSIGLRTYMNLGRSLMEFTAFRRLQADALDDLVSSEGMKYLDEALSHGRGAILFTGHYGNWELLGGIVAHNGYPIHVTVYDHQNKMTDGLMCDLRRRLGMRVIYPREPVEKILGLLASNQFVSILADQDARGSGVFVEFLGRPASTMRGPAVLAVRQKCPIIPCFMIRIGRDRHRAIIEEPIWPDSTLRGEAAIADLTQKYTRRLEHHIRLHPELYFWPHRRWKTTPPPSHRH